MLDPINVLDSNQVLSKATVDDLSVLNYLNSVDTLTSEVSIHSVFTFVYNAIKVTNSTFHIKISDQDTFFMVHIVKDPHSEILRLSSHFIATYEVVYEAAKRAIIYRGADGFPY